MDQKDQPPPYSPPPAGFVPPPQHDPKYAPQPPHNYPHQPETTTTHIVIRQAVQFGPQPQRTTCPHCHADILSRVENEPSSKTHLFALLLCLFQCYLCCCIPYCVDSCQSQKHTCPNCGAYLGSYSN